MSEAELEELKNIIKCIEEFKEFNTQCFLPNEIPMITIDKRYNFLSDGCNNLPNYYHGTNKNCQSYVNKLSENIPRNFEQDIKKMSKRELEALMTRVSILSHAFRWKRMPAEKEMYQINEIFLPPLLSNLWESVSNELRIPKVGNFYSIISNNWIFKKPSQSNDYDSNEITLENVDLLFNWLLTPQKYELKNFIITALFMEAQGKKILSAILKIYKGILYNNPEDTYVGFDDLFITIKSIVKHFNKNIKINFINPTNFLTHIQPTMIWLIDKLEGANGTQSCTMQLLDSFFQIDKDSDIGMMIKRSRFYTDLSHKNLLNTLDNLNIDFKQLILKENIKIIDLYNNCLNELIKWRESHKIRGAKYLKGDKDSKVSHYTSSGLAVKLNVKREDAFKDLMQSHIINTKKHVIK